MVYLLFKEPGVQNSGNKWLGGEKIMNLSDDNDLIANISSFVSSFGNHIENIGKIAIESNPKRYKKILYVSVLEGIASARYPSKRPRDRFIKLVHSLGGWNDSERISLPHLVAALERTSDGRFEEIREFFYLQLRDWGSGGPTYLDKDPLFSEVQKRWPKEEGRDIKMKCLNMELKKLRHVELLYGYRNYLVHQSIQVTQSPAEGEDLYPFYEAFDDHLTIFGNKVSEWHLVYPHKFLEQLCKTCLISLEQYLKDNRKDPYLVFKDAWYVVEEFNDSVEFPVLKPFYQIS